MTSILREFEKTMNLEPVQVNYTEPSILDSVDLSNATSTLSFSNYEISFDKSEASFDEEDNREQEPPKPINDKVELPFSLFYVGGKGILSTKQVQSLKDYLIAIRPFAVKHSATSYNNLVDLANFAISGHAVSRKDINRLSEELFNEMKSIFEQQNN